jgi:uncharacterized membrane protein (TIGR02234 family)
VTTDRPVTPGTSDGHGPTASAARPDRRRAILVVLALALLTLLTAVPVWLRTSGSTALQGEVPVSVAGTQAAPGIPAAALVLLSAGVAIGLVGRAGRWVLVGAVALSGALAVVSAALVLADPGEPARTAVAAATGVETLVTPVALSLWPSVAVAVGLLVVAAAGWLAATSGRWARPSARHDRDDRDAAAGAVAPDDDRAAWDALSRGQDPT